MFVWTNILINVRDKIKITSCYNQSVQDARENHIVDVQQLTNLRHKLKAVLKAKGVQPGTDKVLPAEEFPSEADQGH